MNSGDFKLLIGLGNPGTEYHKTRHNMGFMILEEMARLNNSTFRENKKFKGKTCEVKSGEAKRVLLMPSTYMNESGQSVRLAKDWFGYENKQLLVLVDDMDLPLGKIRIREKGSAGGHNGLKSIINHLGTNEFTRLRIGIGPPSEFQNDRKTKTISHVLGKFSNQELVIVSRLIEEIIHSIESIQTSDWEKFSTRLNSFLPKNL